MLGKHPEYYAESEENQPYLPGFEPPIYNPSPQVSDRRMIAILSAGIGYSLLLAINPHWAEDLFSFIQSSNIGR
jgi:hypothetical protein